MDKGNCILKMEKILHDTVKLGLIDPFCDCDNTAKVDSEIQRRVLQLKKRCCTAT